MANPYDQPFGENTNRSGKSYEENYTYSKSGRRKKKNPYDEDIDFSDVPENRYQNNGGREVAAQVVEAKQQEQKKEPRKRSIFERIGDKFEANSPEDKEKRLAQGKPELYKDEKTKGYSSIGNRIGDIFEANSPQDIAKREARGEEPNYQHQQALKDEAKNRNQNFNFTKEEVDARRDYYKRQGIDIDKAIGQKEKYGEVFNEKLKASDRDWKKLAEEAKAEGLLDGKDDALGDFNVAPNFRNPKMQQQFYRQALGKALKDLDPKNLKDIEDAFGRYTSAQSGNENTAQQAARNFAGGIADTFMHVPSNLQSLASNTLDIVAPEGSRVDKYAQERFEDAARDNAGVKQEIIDKGAGTNEKDSFVGGTLSRGAGSLAAAAMVGPGGEGEAAAGLWNGVKAFLKPSVVGTVFGVNKGGDIVRESKAAGKGDLQAGVTSLAAGYAEGVLENWGLKKIFGNAGEKVLGSIVENALTEGSQEFLQDIVTSGLQNTYKSVDWSQAVGAAIQSGYTGAVLGGGAGGISAGFGSPKEAMQDNLEKQGVSKEDAEKIATQYDEKLKAKAEQSGNETGDDIVKQLNGGDQGQAPIPDNGDAIVKELQGMDGTSTPAGGVGVADATDEQLAQWGEQLQKRAELGDPAAKSSLEQVTSEIQRRQSQNIPDDGDAIVKELQGNTPTGFAEGQDVNFDGKQWKIKSVLEQGNDTKYELVGQDGKSLWTNKAGLESSSQTDIPDNGDAIVKELQGMDNAPTAPQGEAPLPTSGDAIVKELQGMDGQQNSPEAEKLWEEKYAAKANDLLDQSHMLEEELKAAKAADKPFIQEQLDRVNKEAADLEDAFIAEGNSLAPAERPKGALKPLGKSQDERPAHIVQGHAEAQKMTEASVKDIIAKQLKAYIDRNDSAAKFAQDTDTQGGTFGNFNGQYTSGSGYLVPGKNGVKTKKGEIGVALADGRVFKFKAEDIYNHGKANTKTETAPKKETPAKPSGKSGADYEVRYPEGKDLPKPLKERLPLDDKELQKSGKQVAKPDNKLTARDIERVTGKSISWNKTQLKELIKNSKDLATKPNLTVVNAGQAYQGTHNRSSFAIEYKSADGSQMFRLPLAEIGFSDKRIAASGIKVGDTISLAEVSKGLGKVPVLRNKRTGVDYHAGIDNRTVANMGQSNEVARTPEELLAKIDQLNKAAQATGILRKGQLRSKKAAGLHQATTNADWRKGGLGTIKLRDDVLKNPQAYMTVVAHELSHAMEFAVNGTTGKTYSLFGELTKEETTKINDELKAIVNNIEGKDVAESDPTYFYKRTEMLARYIETMLTEPSKIAELAPTVTEKFQKAVIEHPQLGDLIDAINGKIDEGFRNKTPDWWRDLRQTYQKHLGKKVGDIAYNAELVRRSKLQYWDKQIDDLLKRKFKNVKDDGSLLFRAAEAIKLTDSDGNVEFGTRDFAKATTKEEVKDLKEAGYEFVRIMTDHNGNELALFAKPRYTEEQGKALFEQLTPEGKQLVKDFTAVKTEAKDMFNRELIKDVFKIDAELEGWVHRGLREKPKGRLGTLGSQKKGSLREKTAGMKKQRQAEGGHLEDFRKQMQKALLEAGDAEINNQFITKQLARISKPIAKGAEPDAGWVEVTADLKKGLKLPGETGREKVTVEKVDDMTGEPIKFSYLKPQQRYQVPINLAEHYRNIRTLPEEITRTKKIMMGINKYWAVNVLLHGGTVGTNFIGGGIQYSAKVLNDFYAEVLTGDVTLPQTRKNLAAIVEVLLPHGWSNAPDHVFGGHRSNYAGQFMSGGKFDSKIDKLADVGLKPFSLVESYWKKVISLSEGVKDYNPTVLDKEMINLSKEEEAMIASINEAVDLYAFDYDNTPIWLDAWGRKGGGLIKPFMKYPYKYGKLVTNLATGAFDKSLPANERAAKLLTLTTLMAAALLLQDWRDKEKQTPDGTDKTPTGLNPRGRLFLWEKGGQEYFIRTAKYPFINIASTGKSLIQGDWEEASNVVTDQLGSIGPVSKAILTGLGYTNKYEQYTPKDAMAGQQLASFIPGFRILNDIGRMIDTKPRIPQNFVQGVFGTLPVWGSEETRQKLRGDVRTIKVPEEPATRSKSDKVTNEREMELYRSDILLSALTGIYLTRIKPTEAQQQHLREQRNIAENKIEALLRDGKEDEARKVAQEVGMTIPEGTFKYYRREREKR